MTRFTDIPISELKNKPKHGEPCNNCGLCCRAVLCDLALHVFDRKANPMGPCPALETVGEKKVCGLITHPAAYIAGKPGFPDVSAAEAPAYSEATKYILAAGTGCTARFNGEKADFGFYAQLEEWDRMNWDDVTQAKKLWGLV